MGRGAAGFSRPGGFTLRTGVLATLVLVLVAFVSGCALAVLPAPPKISTSTLGGSLRLHDSSQDIDLSVSVTKVQILDAPEGPPSSDEHRLGVKLSIKNMSPEAFADSLFYSDFYLVKTTKPATPMMATAEGWSPIYGADMPAGTLKDSVTIVSGAVLEGWLWFSIQGKKPAAQAADFRDFHVLSFRPKMSSSVIGMWQLKR